MSFLNETLLKIFHKESPKLSQKNYNFERFSLTPSKKIKSFPSILVCCILCSRNNMQTNNRVTSVSLEFLLVCPVSTGKRIKELVLRILAELHSWMRLQEADCCQIRLLSTSNWLGWVEILPLHSSICHSNFWRLEFPFKSRRLCCSERKYVKQLSLIFK